MPICKHDNIFNKLEARLRQPLPGLNVQKEMSAYPRGRGSINFNFDDDPRESSVLIVLFERHGEICFPLIQRPQYSGIHSGQIGLPGGKVEEQDKNRIETALRETEEEIGVIARDVIIIGKLTELYVRASHYNVMPVVGYLPYIPAYRPDPQEVSKVIEGKIDDLLKDENRKVKELLIKEKYNIIAPYFDINHETVWGATAMILSEFSAVLKEIMN
jgi:8-oxo-dGTP pyrophosphatase MutT (NUDIX family)